LYYLNQESLSTPITEITEISNNSLLKEKIPFENTTNDKPNIDQQQFIKLIQELEIEKENLERCNQALKFKLSDMQNKIQNNNDFISMLERDQIIAANKISSLIHSESMLKQSLEERFEELAILANLLVENEKDYKNKIDMLHKKQSVIDIRPQDTLTSRLKNKLTSIKHQKVKSRQFLQNVAIIRQSELFNNDWYLKNYPESSSHKFGAAGHYLEHSLVLKTNPSPDFDGNWYLQVYEDVNVAGMNPLLHYIKFGIKENREIKVL